MTNYDDHTVIHALRRTGILAPRYIEHLLAHGRPYASIPLPEGMRRFPAGQCIEASEHLKRRHGLARVQGWCVGPPSLIRSGKPFWHAFNTSDDETAIDASLPDPEECHYFGVPGPDRGDEFDHMVLGMPRKPRSLLPRDLSAGAFTRSLERSFRF